MSSISVVWTKRLDGAAIVLLRRMSVAQAGVHSARSFSWTDEQIALGGSLLGLLPEDQFDRQPIWNQSRTLCLVADVRLDNRSDLARELHLTQPELLADSDVLLAAWERWQGACLNRIVGSFAFAVWTPARQELFAARDHTGDRPLYFTRTEDFFALASMPRALLSLPGVRRGVQETRLVDALALANPNPRQSFYAGIERLPQAHMLRITPHAIECKPYWSPFDAPPVRYAKDSEYTDAFLEIFDRSVAARLRCNKTVVSQLSAGMDSSSVTVSAARALASQGKRLTAFTAVPRPGFLGKGFHGRIPDEGPGAAEVAAMYPNIDHVRIDSAGIELIPTLHRTIDALDEPVQNGINLLWLTAILQQAAAGGAGALLVGSRGNATLSYTGLDAFAHQFRAGKLFSLLGTVYRMRKKGYTSWRGALAQATTGILPNALHRFLRRSGEFTLKYSPASPEILERYQIYDKMLKEFYDNSTDLDLERRIFFERFDYGVYNAAMRSLYGIDMRDPCGDKRLFDFCYAIPIEQYIVGDEPRSLVRRAMKDRLPPSTLARTIRGQQGADWYLSMQDARPSLPAEATIIEQSPTARRMLDLPRMRALLATWPETGLEQLDTSHSYGDALCRFMSFGYFLAKSDEAMAQPLTPPPV